MLKFLTTKSDPAASVVINLLHAFGLLIELSENTILIEIPGHIIPGFPYDLPMILPDYRSCARPRQRSACRSPYVPSSARHRRGVRFAPHSPSELPCRQFVRRAKNGTPSTHPLTGRELRALRKHQRESPKSPFVFVSERDAPFSAPGFSRMVERAGIAAKLGIKAHAHMLRHATGFKLANDGIDTRSLQAYLGHRNIQNTTRYTALAPNRFKGFFRD